MSDFQNAQLVFCLSILCMIGAAIWGRLDKRLEHTIGATVVFIPLAGSLWCGATGNFIPWGAGLIMVAVFVWFLTLGSISFGKGQKA